MEKWLCWGALGISGLLFILFVLDLVTKSIPFGGLSTVVNILAAAACAIDIGAYTYRSVKSILDNNLDRHPKQKVDADREPISHPNIRGPRYYN